MAALLCFWILYLAAVGQCQDTGLSVAFSIQSPDNTSRPVSKVQINTTSTNRLIVLCKVFDISQLKAFNSISIHKLNATGMFQRLAYMTNTYSVQGQPKLDLLYESMNAVAIGTNNLTNPIVGISVPVSNLSCEDTTTYKCSLSYITNNEDPLSISTNRSFGIFAPPSTLDMDAINISSGLPITFVGFSSANLATFMIGQAVNLTCNASLGTHKDATIRWKKNNKAMGNEADYSESNAHLVSKCAYEKTGSLVYNITEDDAMYTSYKPLVLQCLVYVADTSFETPEDERRSFYIQVYNPNPPTTTTTTTVPSFSTTTVADVSNGHETSTHGNTTSAGSRIKFDPVLFASSGLMFMLKHFK